MAVKWSKAPKLSLYSGEAEGQGRTYVDPSEDPAAKLRYPSVTTALKMEDKSGMMGWAALMVAKKAVERYEDLGKDPDWVMSWLPYAHNDFRDERAWVGSGVHAAIQAEIEESWEFPELNDEQLQMMNQWARFNDAYEVKPIGVERTRRGDGWMGTYDLLARLTDRITGETWVSLIDFKTSRNIHRTHYLQLAALNGALWEFIEVDEGTEGAYLRKWKNPETGKMENTYWLKRPAVRADKVQILHIRAEGWKLITITPEMLKLREAQFYDYLGAFEKEQQAKELQKREGDGDDS